MFVALSGCPLTTLTPFGKTGFSEDEWHDCLHATGYVKGVDDALDLAPAGVTYGQVYEIVYTYLKNHINQRQRQSVGLIRDALTEAFQSPNK